MSYDKQASKVSYAQSGIFRASEVYWTVGTAINILSTTHQRNVWQRKMLELFILDAIKTAFQMRQSTHR